MSNITDNNSSAPANDMPFAAPCKTLDMYAPLRWLHLGWIDITRAPRLSLIYGFALTLLNLLVSVFTWHYGKIALYIGLAAGLTM